MKFSGVLSLLALTCIPAAAQPVIKGIANAASYLVSGAPNAGIAQGSMFVIFGTGLGPDTLTQASSYPLPQNQGLAGTTVNINTVSFAGQANAIIIYTSANQIAAIAPSTLNYTGNVVVTVTYNGRTSSTAFMKLLPSAFGTFTVNQSGTGAAVAYNYISDSSQPLNSLGSPAKPGQLVTLWGTGLGPVKGAEAGGALPGQLSLNLQLVVGGKTVTPSYYGRSGCCAGIDQIVFPVPAAVTGCIVPVAVVINGIVSNTASIAVSPDGSACSDPLGPSSMNVQNSASNGSARFASVSITHSTGGNPADSGSAIVATTPFATYNASLSGLPAAGGCVVSTVGSSSSAPPAAFQTLDAGASLQVDGPSGTGQLTKGVNGTYAGNLPAMHAGNYTLTGSGGNDVGPFSASLTIPAATGTLNFQTTGALVPGSPLTVNWTGGDPASYITITGLSGNTTTNLLSAFICMAAPGSGAFTVPAYITAGLTPGTGALDVAQWTVPVAFSAPGIDQGYFNSSVGVLSGTFTVGNPGGGTKE